MTFLLKKSKRFVLSTVTFLNFILLCFFFVGCDNMRNDAKFKPYEASTFFEDGSSSRPIVKGTVARGQLFADDHLYRAKVNGEMADSFPFPVTEEVIARGKERFDIYCSVCHDKLGYGNGMVVQRGMKQPPSFHDERLRTAPSGYFYGIISEGIGNMRPYAAEVKPEDRWAIIAYIRALQLSQNMPLADIPQDEQNKLLKELH